MLPILKALKDRLLNEPVFFLSAASAAALVLNDSIPLPAWVKAVAALVAGLAARSVVTGPKTAG
jgi:hypothetical protein